MKHLPFVIFLFVINTITAQTYNDEALLYARSGISGTARSIGSASAFGSVGADLGSMAVNPAGLGLYRSTDFAITPGLNIANNQAEFDGSLTKANSTKIFFNQAGVAFCKLLNKEQKANDFSFSAVKLKAITFAINYQRESMFNRVENFSGTNLHNSGIDAYTAYVNSTFYPFDAGHYPPEMVLAWQTALIDFDSVNHIYVSNVRPKVLQTGNIVSKGAVDHVDIAFGGNLNDKFYFGAGVGFSILTYSRDATFTEVKGNDTLHLFQDYTYTANNRATGLGINAKFGIIYRPAAFMRLGLAYQIPTFYNLTENYLGTTTSYFDTASYSLQLEQYPLKYKIREPMKGTASASFYFKEYGFLSVDYEFQNYGSTKFDFGSDYKAFSDATNADQKKYYTFNHTVRAGFEGSYKTLLLRCGYAFSTTPYKKDYVMKGYAETKHNITAGIGYRGKRFYADFAYAYSTTKEANSPYADFVAKNTFNTHTAFITIGWRITKENTETMKSKEAKGKPKMSF